jgi:hypothetical protein
VLAQKYLKPWQVFLAVKWLELSFHLQPARLWREVRRQDRFARRQLSWSLLHISLVWLAEVWEFIFATRLEA